MCCQTLRPRLPPYSSRQGVRDQDPDEVAIFPIRSQAARMGLESELVNTTSGCCRTLVRAFHRSLRSKSCCPHCMLPGSTSPVRSLLPLQIARVGNTCVRAATLSFTAESVDAHLLTPDRPLCVCSPKPRHSGVTADRLLLHALHLSSKGAPTAW